MSSVTPTKNRNELAPTTTQPWRLCGTKLRYVTMTANQIATPPIIAVGFLCQRSLVGRATKPRRRDIARITGVRARARASDTTEGVRFDKLIESIAI